VNEEGIEVGDLPLLAVVGREGVVVVVGFIEDGVEAAEEGGHGEVDATMAVVYGGVDEHGLLVGIAEEIAAPEVPVEEGGRFGRKDVEEGLVEALELLVGFGVEEAILGGQPYLGLKATVDEEVDPVRGGGVVLGKGAHVVVVVEAEMGMGDVVGVGLRLEDLVGAGMGRGDPVEAGEGFAEGMPETGGPGALVDPFQDEDLGVVYLRAGYGGGDADQLLVTKEGEAAVLFCKQIGKMLGIIKLTEPSVVKVRKYLIRIINRAPADLQAG
jgi:hypothetical protein